MKTTLSVEENNYIRLVLLLNGLALRAVRYCFDTEFPPNKLPATLNSKIVCLNKLKSKGRLTNAQWNLLFPTNGKPTTSITFDLTLMICLIRNLTSTTKPRNGYDSLPPQWETTLGSDLARIKCYRNKLNHHDSTSIVTAYFNIAWRNITDAVFRLGDPAMKQECQELKVKILDQSDVQEIKEHVLASKEELSKLNRAFDSLNSRHKELTKRPNIFVYQWFNCNGKRTGGHCSNQSPEEIGNRNREPNVIWNTGAEHVDLRSAERRSSTIPGDSLDSKEKRQRINPCVMITLISLLIVGCISGSVAWLLIKKDSNDPPPTIMHDYPSSPDKCDNDISTATIGEQICIPFTQKITGKQSRVDVKQKSSKYCSASQSFSVNILSDNFVRQIGDWFVFLNSSRTDQQVRIVKKKATCDNIGSYEMNLYNDVDNFISFKFAIRLKEPTLQQNVTRIHDIIHVHCEMTANCIASSLALVVNHEQPSKEVPDTNFCSNNDMMGGTKLSVNETFPISKFSESQTISCVPVMDDIELAANLTSTTNFPFCEGDDCVYGCKEDSQSISYYSNIDFCNRFYQCSNGELVSHTCSNKTYWSPSKCNCVHLDGAICDQKTKRFSKPTTTKKCTN